MDGYRSKQWKAFRDEVLRLDGYRCGRCLRQHGEVVLQVHHKKYIPGRKPWEYSHDMCEAICKGCHAEEHGIIPPSSGWTLDGYDDLGDRSGHCDACGTELRYIFMVSHPNWAAMEVGTDCCDRMTGNAEASKFSAERVRLNNQRKRFVSSVRWRTLQSGGEMIQIKQLRILVYGIDGQFAIKVNGHSGKRRFPAIVDAKGAVFDLLETKQIQRYASKKGLILSLIHI